MIRELRVTDRKRTPVEWWEDIEGFKRKRVFKFEPGVNILWGPNGSGKSSVLQALARLTHCAQAGIPKITPTSLEFFREDRLKRLTSYSLSLDDPKRYRTGMTLVQDGQPVHFFSGEHTPGLTCNGAAFDYDFGMEDVMLTMGVRKISSGQRTNAMSSRILESAAKLEKIEDKAGRLNDHWSALKERAVKSLEATCELGQPTLLLDEPDRSLDLPAQANFWGVLRAQKRFQIIVATHCPFALGLNANYIDLSKGYLNECLETVRGLNV